MADQTKAHHPRRPLLRGTRTLQLMSCWLCWTVRMSRSHLFIPESESLGFEYLPVLSPDTHRDIQYQKPRWRWILWSLHSLPQFLTPVMGSRMGSLLTSLLFVSVGKRVWNSPEREETRWPLWWAAYCSGHAHRTRKRHFLLFTNQWFHGSDAYDPSFIQNSHKVPPPWLIAMQRYGPPPSYPNLKIPGLNSPIPDVSWSNPGL